MVEKKEIFRKIDEVINELNNQHQYLSKNQDNFNELELELLAANANFLAEHIKIIQKLHSTKKPSLAETAIKTESQQQNESPVSDKQEDKPEAAEDIKPENPRIEQEEVSYSKSNDTPEETPSEKKQPVENSKPVPAPDEPVINEVVIREKTISIDNPVQDKPKAGDPVPTVNDIISAQRNHNTLGDSYSRKSVADLKAIISMNDKLLFVKDLFNGYNLAYSEAIELLNRFDNFEAADNFLKNNYAAKNNWAEKQGTVDKFYEILNRRFAK